MVVNRKQPSAPAPPTSRTNSTQALPRTSAKSSHSNLSKTARSESSSRDVPNGNLHTKHKTKAQKAQDKPPLVRKRKRSLLDRLFILFLTTFAVYALYTCPNNDNSVCRSLKTYHTHVLEPYVIPSIRAVVSHPTVVEPYEKYAKPVYQDYIEPVTPYVAAVHRRTAPYVGAAIRVTHGASSRIWNKLIVPYWTRAVVPRYTLYVHPHVNKYVNPVIRRVKHYNSLVEPHLRCVAHYTTIYAGEAQKYALVAYGRTQPHVSRVYAALKPHLLRGYAQVKPLACYTAGIAQSNGKYVASKVFLFFKGALGHIGDLRREFVDPPVLRIWEKAVEKSDSSIIKASSITAAITTSASTLSEASSEVPVSSNDTPTANVAMVSPTVEAVPEPVAATTSTSIEFDPPSSTAFEEVTSIPDPVISEIPILDIPVPTPTPEEILEKATSVAEESAGHASNVIGDLEREIKETEAAQAILTPSVDHGTTSTPSETPSSPPDVAQEFPAPVLEEEDLDDFLREIGLSEEEQQPESESKQAVPPPPTEEDIEAQKEAKRAATAAKRADIVGRHVRWQSEIDSLVKDLTGRLIRDLETIRTEAVAHIGKLPSDKDSAAADGKGKEVLESLQNDGVKFLKGLEVYVGRLTTQAVNHDELEKEQEKWDKVVDKVDEKFKDAVINIQEEIHGWYVQVRETEGSTALVAANEVKSLADRAQTDLGLDYAWLDDVSYYDWQNYHDLMRTYDRFYQTARALQNGTHSDAPEDKLVPVLDNLDREMRDIIDGFTMKMNLIVREGDKWFDDNLGPMPEPEAEVEGEEQTTESEEEEPPVSILPISPEPSIEKVDPANVVIGKSPEQIEKMAQQAVVDQRIEL